MCGPFKRTEIPLDVLVKLLDSGFDVNALGLDTRYMHSAVYLQSCLYDYGLLNLQSCLYAAVCNEHYDAARCLVQYGHADCNIGAPYYDYNGSDVKTLMETPLYKLCKHPNAPLDLVDMLATAESLTSSGNDDFLPLTRALDFGHTEIALRLIQLGAMRFQCVKLGAPIYPRYKYRLPIGTYTTYLIQHAESSSRFHDVLYTSLIPSDTMAILGCVENILYLVDYNEYKDDWEQDADMVHKMLHRLFQSIMPYDQMHISFEKSLALREDEFDDGIRLVFLLNKKTVSLLRYSSESAYWWSVIFVNLGWNFTSVPQATGVLKIDKMWNEYRSTVRSLQNLCIQ